MSCVTMLRNSRSRTGSLPHWLTADREARRLQRAHEKRAVVDDTLTRLIERAFQVAEAAARGTPYGSPADSGR